MRRRSKILIALPGTILIAIVTWLYRPYARPDTNRVHSRIQQLHLPLQELQVRRYCTCGNFAIQLVDAQGTKLELAVPVSPNGQRYRAIYLDTTDYHDTNAPVAKIADPTDSALRLQSLLREATPPDKWRDIALYTWSGRGRDKLRFLFRKLSGQYPTEK